MTTDLIHDRGRGPEIVGTRITVYNLLPYFLDPSATELYICQVNGLTSEQVAAARAYVLNHVDSVLAEHLRIEARIADGNRPGAIEKAQKTRETFTKFKEWLAQRNSAAAGMQTTEAPGERATKRLAAFRDWMAQEEAALGERS